MLRQVLRVITSSVKVSGLQVVHGRQTQAFRMLNFHPNFQFASLPKHSEMKMPALSPTMDKGNIIKWLKKEGDKVETGDVLCEVETDKATVGFEVQQDGYLAKIMYPEGTKDIMVGELVAIVVSKKADVSAFQSYNPNDTTVKATTDTNEKANQAQKVEAPQTTTTSKPQQAEKPTPTTQPEKQGKQYPKYTKLGLPALSPTMESGNIMKWMKKVGDKLEPGDVVCEVETDKATVGYEVQEDSYLAKILIEEGAKNIALGATLAITTPKKEFVKEFSDFNEHSDKQQTSGQPQTQDKSQAQEPQEKQSQAKQSAQEQPKSQKQDRLYASPLAIQYGREQNVDLHSIKGTGISNSVTKVDIDNYLKSAPKQQQKQAVQEEKQEQRATTVSATPPAAAVAATTTTAATPTPAKQTSSGLEQNPYQDIEVSSIRKIIANRLLESKTTIPHYYLTMRINMDALLQLREELNKISKVRISVNDFIVKASALALRDIPEVNSQWQGTTIRKFVNADICVAVSTDNGLITPIVFNAGAKGLSTIATTTKLLAEKARTNKLKPAEFQGGTFTISNLGMFGIDSFIAVINPPQAAILAVGKTSKNIVPDDVDLSKNRVLSQMDVTLSCDHRVVDGAVGAQWLQKFKAYLESPSSMLL